VSLKRAGEREQVSWEWDAVGAARGLSLYGERCTACSRAGRGTLRLRATDPVDHRDRVEYLSV
jgi:hypothetical protein